MSSARTGRRRPCAAEALLLAERGDRRLHLPASSPGPSGSASAERRPTWRPRSRASPRGRGDRGDAVRGPDGGRCREFAAAGVEVAVVEAGLGGRHDATNVLDATTVVLTNVALEHTDVLGHTQAEIAAEKLAVVRPDAGALVVLGEPEWAEAARAAGAFGVTVVAGRRRARARRWSRASAARSTRLRSRRRRPGPARAGGGVAARDLGRRPQPRRRSATCSRVPAADWVLVVSILADKDAAGMLAALSALGGRLVATSSSSPRALPANRLAALGRPFFAHVEVAAEPGQAHARGRVLAGEDGALLVTGSLCLLADLASVRPSCLPWQASVNG